MTIELTIRRLTSELLDDLQQFFDGDALSGHEEWAGCHCLESHLDPKKNERLMPFDGVLETRRRMAMAMVEQGVTNGYPVYDGSCVIGWCNAGDKRDYLPVCREEQLITEPHERGKTKLLYCFDIVPPCWSSVFWPTRSRSGYLYAEAHPSRDTDFPCQYRGPIRLYRKYGFETYRETSWCLVMRKAL